MKYTSLALLVSWNLIKESDTYYISNTHYNYLKFISDKYDKVYLISTISSRYNNFSCKKIDLEKIQIVELPMATSYISSLKNVCKYYRMIKVISAKTDLFYCRVPDPFSWIPALLFKKKTIMHFVGDTIDATKYNEKWNWLKKQIMIMGYYPDYLLTILASRTSIVYTNGYHISKKLKKYSVKSVPVISSTISKNMFNNELPVLKDNYETINLIYVGFIRYSKGINCLINLCNKLKNENVNFVFNIIGVGEMFGDLEKYILSNDLSNKVVLHGYIDDKTELLKKMRESDLFLFPSLSEGSPRVVIEAMSQKIPVLATPVGSLPTTFQDKVDIRFFDFNDYEKAFDIIQEYMGNREEFIEIGKRAYLKVKENYTIESFLNKVFTV